MSAYRNFEEASRDILSLLHKRMGFGLWMVTRAESDNWIVLHAKDEKYNVKKGDVFHWSDSFCSRMVKGLGPKVAPKSKEVNIYTNSPIAQQVDIDAYIGMPLILSNGDLFGTLCAIDDVPHSDALIKEEELINILSKLLVTVIEKDLEKENISRREEQIKIIANSDHMTGLLNRGGWDKFISLEEERSNRYGSPCAVAIFDLDNLKETNDTHGHDVGDKLIIKTSKLLDELFRENDVVARIGGDEFAVLIIESDFETSREIMARVKEKIKDENIHISIGWSQYDPRKDYKSMIKAADEEMYAEKKIRRKIKS